MLEPVALLHDKENLKGPHDIEIQGDLAFVAGKWGAFSVVDVADPMRPEILGVITEGMVNPETVLPAGEICFLGTEDFYAIDVRNPTQPKVLKQISDGKIGAINGMVRWGDTILAANKIGRVGVIDMQNPGAPVQVANVAVGYLSPCGLTKAGNVLYVGTGRLVEALDVSDPLHPISIGRSTVFPEPPRDNQNNQPGDAHDLVVKNGYIFVTGQNDSSLGVVRIT